MQLLFNKPGENEAENSLEQFFLKKLKRASVFQIRKSFFFIWYNFSSLA